MRRTLVLCAFFLFLAGLAKAAEPQRSDGISIHMLPKRVAQISGKPWGLSIDYSPRLKAETTQPVLKTSEALLAYVRKQDATVRQNGVWIVITNPASYSADEMQLLEDVKLLCQRNRIPLFITRASEMPNGWKRHDQ